jgi:cytochrome c peroxidase
MSSLRIGHDQLLPVRTRPAPHPGGSSSPRRSLPSPGRGCERTPISAPTTTDLDKPLGQWLAFSGVAPVLAVPAQEPALVDLGRALFFDKILSGNRDISCATCHDPSAALGDARSLSVGTGAVGQGLARALGPGRQYVPRNAPSLLNQGFAMENLFWDARVAELFPGPRRYRTPAGTELPEGLNTLLAAQAMFPVLNRTEMRGEAGDRDVFGAENEIAKYGDEELTAIWKALMRRLLAIDGYAVKFKAAYPDVPSAQLGFEHAANALAAYQAQVFTFNDSPFDRYLAGKKDALSDEAKQGALVFYIGTRCSACHFGPLMGSRTFAATGTAQVGPGVGGDAPLDRGMSAQFVGQTRFIFRVPPLRNVELSAPYMHAGAYPTLESVVRHYTNVEKAVRSYDATQLSPSLRGMYHGDAGTVEALVGSLDLRIRQPFNLTDAEQKQLVTFLKALTDPKARDLSALFPASVPSGLPVR